MSSSAPDRGVGTLRRQGRDQPRLLGPPKEYRRSRRGAWSRRGRSRCRLFRWSRRNRLQIARPTADVAERPWRGGQPDPLV